MGCSVVIQIPLRGCPNGCQRRRSFCVLEEKNEDQDRGSDDGRGVEKEKSEKARRYRGGSSKATFAPSATNYSNRITYPAAGIRTLSPIVNIAAAPREGGLAVLVVDDARLNRKMLCHFLRSRCTVLHEAEDGKEALHMIQDSLSHGLVSYDVVLMDNQMPNMSGPEAAKKMRAAGYRGVIVGVSGHVAVDDKFVFLSNGADEFLSKPLNFDALSTILAGE